MEGKGNGEGPGNLKLSSRGKKKNMGRAKGGDQGKQIIMNDSAAFAFIPTYIHSFIHSLFQSVRSSIPSTVNQHGRARTLQTENENWPGESESVHV